MLLLMTKSYIKQIHLDLLVEQDLQVLRDIKEIMVLKVLKDIKDCRVLKHISVRLLPQVE